MLVIALLFYSFWLLHLDTAIKKNFKFCLVPEALLRCRVVVVASCPCREAKPLSRAQLWYNPIPRPIVPGEQVQVVRLRGDQLLQLLKQGEERPQQHAQVHLNETYKTS